MTLCNCGQKTCSACTGNGDKCECGGEQTKHDKLAMLEARRAVYVNRGRRALLGRLLVAGEATADDVIAAVHLPVDIDPRCLGAVPGPLARAGIICSTGFVKSTRPQRHASYIQAWQLTDPDEAQRWLAANPDMPDPAPEQDGHAETLFDLDNYHQKERPAAVTTGR